MTTKGSFENQYEEYYCPVAANNVLNESKDGISDRFKSKLQSFKEAKFHILSTKFEKDIFHDGSVYTGSAGFAMYYLMCTQKTEDNLLVVYHIADNALSELNYEAKQHYTYRNLRSLISQLSNAALRYLNLNALKGRRISFLCGDAGPLAIGTVLSYRLGAKRPASLPEYKHLAQRLMSLIAMLDDSPDEILYGKAGYLYALLFVNKHIPEKDVIPANHIEKVINSILNSGKQFASQMKSQSPLLYQWHDKIYFGAAHGMAGILYMLLQARKYINVSELRNYIKPAVDWLLSHRFQSGNFPSSLGSASGDKLVQWCHGAPGFVPLCILAYQTLEDEKYLKIALKCGEVIWARGLCAKGYSLCHGVSGNAYAFLQLYQATKRPVHLYRACCFMEWCAVERPGTELHRPDRPASLFEGLIGRLYLVADISRPLDARFPGLCL